MDCSVGEDTQSETENLDECGFEEKEHLSNLNELLEVLAVADRFLLPDLVHYLSAQVATRAETGEWLDILQFSVFHTLKDLGREAARGALLAPLPLPVVADRLEGLATGPCRDQVGEALMAVFRKGLANTH